MHSHTISVHFRCPLLLFWLSFWCPICPICPHLSTLIFGCLHPDMPPRSMPQPVPRRPPSQSDTAHRCSLLPQKRQEDSFSSHGQPRYSCHPFPAQTANFRGLCCFSQRKSHHRESLLPPPPARKPCHSHQAPPAVFLPLNGCFPLNTSPADTKADTSRARRHPQGSLPLPPPPHFRPQPQHFYRDKASHRRSRNS